MIHFFTAVGTFDTESGAHVLWKIYYIENISECHHDLSSSGGLPRNIDVDPQLDNFSSILISSYFALFC